MDSQGACGDLPASELGTTSEVKAVPEGRYKEEGGGDPEGVDREQARSPEDLAARGRDGQDRAEDGAGAEAGEPVDRAEDEGRTHRYYPDPSRQAGARTEVEAAREDMQHPQRDDDEAGDRMRVLRSP